jgi:hypothetical protein
MTPLLALALACAPPEPPVEDAACDDLADTQVFVVKHLTFARRTDGVSVGFDLDGDVSEADDAAGCYQPDLVDPDGVPGIDNAFSAFLPVLEATEGAALEGLVQSAIDSGELLLMLELQDVDDPADDTCVNLDVSQGIGTPLQGTDGEMLSGQTFDRDPATPDSRVEGVAIVDGTVVARGFEMHLPIQIFEVYLDLLLHDAALSMTVEPDGTAHGYIAGGFEVQQIVDVMQSRDDIAIADLVISMVETYADLYPDETGACPEFSAVLEFEATSAFFFTDSP